MTSVYADATHLIGGYMNYRYLGRATNGNSRYLITLNVYRDCFQSTVNLDPEIQLGVYLNNQDNDRYTVSTFTLNTKTKVQPPGSVDCDYYARNVCIEYGQYTGIIELPNFTGGYHLTFVRCCRNTQTNLPNSGGTPYQGQTYYCFIPSTSYENSSPVFSGVPSPYMCSNDTTTFLFNAVDPDGDELSYRLVRPFQGGDNTGNSTPAPPPNLNLPIDPVVYNPGYSYIEPFGSSGYTSVNNSTGLTTFYSPNTGSYVVGVEVTEKRNGVVLSTIRMDLQILVLDCPPNDRPKIKTASNKYFYTMEAGSTLCFDVTATDPDDDLVKLTAKGPILEGTNGYTGTLASFSNAAAYETVTSEFCWTPDCDAGRADPYEVTFHVEDDGCPPKLNYITVEIKVDSFIGADIFDGPSEVCEENSYIYQIIGGQLTSTYEWQVTNGVIEGSASGDVVKIRWDNAGTGEVRVREISQYGCPGEWLVFPVTISPSPPIPVIQGKDTVCENETNLGYSVTSSPGFTYTWDIVNGTYSSENNNSVTIGSYSAPEFILSVIAENATGCASDTGFLNVFVSIPNPALTGPLTVCPNSVDVAYTVVGNSGSTYNWTVTGGNLTSGNGSPSIQVTWGDEGIGTMTVQETNRHGCTSPVISVNVAKSYTLSPNGISGPIEICEFETDIPYSTLDVSGSVFTWTIAGGSQSSGDSSNAITVDWGSAGNGGVTVIQRAYDAVNNRWCVSSPVTLPVTIYPVPVIGSVTGPTELCEDETATYTASGFADSRFIWAINGDTSAISGQGTSSVTIPWPTAGNYVLTVVEESVNGCISEAVNRSILINPRPQTSPIVGETNICPENADNQVYTVNGLPNSSFQWEVFGERSFTGQNTSSITVNWEPSVAWGRVRVLEVSDKGCVGDTQELDVSIQRLVIDLKVVSVGEPDDRMYIYWNLPYSATQNDFLIEKRTAGSPVWTSVTTVPYFSRYFEETGINTDITAFEYRISSVNQCGTTIFSGEHTNVLLTGTQDENLNINLTFSDYLGWMNGVQTYTLYESTNGSPYSIVNAGMAPGDVLSIASKPEEFRKCFRIQATEYLGYETISWSNDLCFTFTPEVYVPNAFTPNSNGLNDEFGVRGVAVNEYHIQIFNRWGEKLYESFDINEKWIPVYQNKEVMMGTYVYLITFTDFENNAYTKKGTINLLR